jgi:hypothetical protein
MSQTNVGNMLPNMLLAFPKYMSVRLLKQKTFVTEMSAAYNVSNMSVFYLLKHYIEQKAEQNKHTTIKNGNAAVLVGEIDGCGAAAF